MASRSDHVVDEVMMLASNNVDIDVFDAVK